MKRLEVLRKDPEAILPVRAHPEDAGLDLHSLEDLILEPARGAVARTGIAVGVRPGFVGLIRDRSSLARRGVKTAGGVIDAGYQGEVSIVLWNLSNEVIQLRRGERIAQLLILPICIPEVEEVNGFDQNSSRGQKGFGSTGR